MAWYFDYTDWGHFQTDKVTILYLWFIVTFAVSGSPLPVSVKYYVKIYKKYSLFLWKIFMYSKSLNVSVNYEFLP